MKIPENGLWLVLKMDGYSIIGLEDSDDKDGILDDVDAVVCATEEVAKSYQQAWKTKGCATDVDRITVRTKRDLKFIL